MFNGTSQIVGRAFSLPCTRIRYPKRERYARIEARSSVLRFREALAILLLVGAAEGGALVQDKRRPFRKGSPNAYPLNHEVQTRTGNQYLGNAGRHLYILNILGQIRALLVK